MNMNVNVKVSNEASLVAPWFARPMGTHTRGRRGAPPLHSVGDVVEQALEKALERRREIARIKLMIAP